MGRLESEYYNGFDMFLIIGLHGDRVAVAAQEVGVLHLAFDLGRWSNTPTKVWLSPIGMGTNSIVRQR